MSLLNSVQNFYGYTLLTAEQHRLCDPPAWGSTSWSPTASRVTLGGHPAFLSLSLLILKITIITGSPGTAERIEGTRHVGCLARRRAPETLVPQRPLHALRFFSVPDQEQTGSTDSCFSRCHQAPIPKPGCHHHSQSLPLASPPQCFLTPSHPGDRCQLEDVPSTTWVISCLLAPACRPHSCPVASLHTSLMIKTPPPTRRCRLAFKALKRHEAQEKATD